MIFLLLFGAVLFLWGLAWLCALGDLLWAKWRKPAHQVAGATYAFKWLSGVGVVFGLLIWLLYFPPLWMVYQQEFGEVPWFNARELRGSVDDSGMDYRKVELNFKASPQTIERIAKASGLTRTESRWEAWTYTKKDKGGRSFAQESVGLEYHLQSRDAHYWYWGWD